MAKVAASVGARYAELEAENARLRELVESAYREGWYDNNQNYAGGANSDWRDSDSREARTQRFVGRT